ncbi:hypothetical protein [Chryseobacterium sp. JUb7]|uniref:hypothetical protein n=1 Tax=Chryseobacterium sp. JUb7 TaxID=2940599 RepID=UPI0021672EE4|nr:hypothetical protein [Chryseobacterium sp. JUb7]MCS3531602.1 hypothetical protein [Chryseobacterium sp. JUb7]
MKTLFNTTILIIPLFFWFGCTRQMQKSPFPKFAEYFSPKSKLSLTIKNQNFELERMEFSGDQVFSTPITNGTCYVDGNILILNGNNKKKYVLEIESEEILTPKKLENTTDEEKFLAWTIYYDNGDDKQNGGWNDNNTKEGVWSYFDKKGNRTQKLYKNGILKDENYKFEWEK